MTVIDAQNLVISYGEVTAVRSLTMQVSAGEVLGLLGGNGAGKSSTLRALAGVNPPTGGTLRVAGNDMRDTRQVEAGRQAVGYCPDVGGLLRQATVREHIALALAIRGRTRMWPQAMELADQFHLVHVMDRVTSGFSHGMCRRLSVLLATITAEQVLILDEPFDGVDPLGVQATVTAIGVARQAGLGVLVSTHLLDVLVEPCDRIAVMADGRLALDTTPDVFATAHGRTQYHDLLRGVV